MNTFLDLLGQILQQFLDLMPHIKPRPATTEWSLVDSWPFGVQLVRRPIVYWPIFDHVETWENTEVPQDPEIQTLTMQCGTGVTVNAAFEYQLIDPIACRSKWGNNYLASMNIKVRSEITGAFMRDDWESVHDIDLDEVMIAIWEKFSEGGIELVSLSIEECASCDSTRHWGVNLAN